MLLFDLQLHLYVIYLECSYHCMIFIYIVVTFNDFFHMDVFLFSRK